VSDGAYDAAMVGRDDILHSLLTERTVDIVTVGRRTGAERITEIWTTPLFGRLFVCGTPNAGKEGVWHQPRDWYANLMAHRAFVLRLKRGVSADLTALAEPVRDPDERRRVLSQPSTAYYRDRAMSFDAALAHSPIVEVHFTGDAAWLAAAIRAASA